MAEGEKRETRRNAKLELNCPWETERGSESLQNLLGIVKQVGEVQRCVTRWSRVYFRFLYRNHCGVEGEGILSASGIACSPSPSYSSHLLYTSSRFPTYMVNRLEELDSPSDSEQLLPFPSLPEERADTPGGLQQDALELDAQEDSEVSTSFHIAQIAPIQLFMYSC